jgi:site-specific DNA-methyltransferase (adenine-specific)
MNTVKALAPSTIDVTGSLLIEGDVRQVLPRLPSNSVQCVVTSPPYWGLRDYGIAGQIGLEETLGGFINTLTSVFAEVRRVLKDDGILWLNIGDGYTSGNRGWRAPDKKNPNRAMSVRPDNPPGLKDKELLGVPWRLAFALQESGWYLRSDIIWHKPNAMPESVKDRPTRAHEYLFMFTKRETYSYWPNAVLEQTSSGGTRNRRSVWSINTAPSHGEHIAGFPGDLVSPCILASTLPGQFVLDPFFGAGTVGVVCDELDRQFVGVELNPGYLQDARSILSSSFRNPERMSIYPEPTHGYQPALLETASNGCSVAQPASQAIPARGSRKRNPVD